MGKENLTNVIKNIQTTLTKHSPEILTGIGIAGMVSTTVLAVKATPKALRLIENAENELSNERCEDVKLKMLDIVKLVWPCYIPAVITCGVSIACLIGGTTVNVKRTAALATAYKISETALNEYKDAVVETIGEKKEKVVKDKVAEKKIKKNPVGNSEVIITKKGETLCYDGAFGRYFKSDIDTIKKAVNVINRNIITDMYASLNDFYDLIGLKPINVGYDLGWNIDDGEIDIYFSSQLAEDGTPCLVIDYSVAPKCDFSSFM